MSFAAAVRAGAPANSNLEHVVDAPRVDARAARRIVDALVDGGVDCVYGIPGGAISGVYDAMMASDIRVVVCQHEQMATYMAYGHARATGRPAAVAVTAGPGVLNTITSVAAAYKDEVPVVILAGEVRRPMAGRGALQDGGEDGLDVINMFRSVTKFADTVQQAERAESLVRQAIQSAMTYPQGPAFLRIPLDATLEEVPSDPVRQASFAVLEPDARGCETIVRAIAEARQPALFVGLGARLAGLGPSLIQFAERLRVPVICDVEAKGLFPESHSLSLGLFGIGGGGAATAYLQECDALVTLGARLDDTTTNAFSALLRPAFLAQLDHDARRLGKAYDPDVAMATELDRAMTMLLSTAELPTVSHVLAREAAVRRAKAADTVVLGSVRTQSPFDPRSVVGFLQSAFPDDTIWTSDIGNHLLAVSRHLVLDRPDCFHASVGLGGMGSGIGVAMGLAEAHQKDRTVVGVCGDGSFRMVGAELATCAKYNTPVVLVVFNDARYGMVAHGMDTVYGRVDYCEAPPVDVVAFAQAMGVRAVRVHTLADLAGAAAMAGDGPLVIDLPIDPDVRILNPRNKTLAH